MHKEEDVDRFRNFVVGLKRGDFSLLEPLFDDQTGPVSHQTPIIEWYEQGLFQDEQAALAETLTCACFNGKTLVAEFLLEDGVDPSGGAGTGMNAFHWAANRGHLDTVRLLIRHN